MGLLYNIYGNDVLRGAMPVQAAPVVDSHTCDLRVGRSLDRGARLCETQSLSSCRLVAPLGFFGVLFNVVPAEFGAGSGIAFTHTTKLLHLFLKATKLN